jgi:hypothetical protein
MISVMVKYRLMSVQGQKQKFDLATLGPLYPKPPRRLNSKSLRIYSPVGNPRNDRVKTTSWANFRHF